MANENLNTARSETQTKRILEYMNNGGHLTPLDALRKFGSFRLSAIIFNLSKNIGRPVNRKRVKVTNPEGKEVWVMEYWLDKKA